ncbi:DNA-binding transcriptional LysR family regulator [Sphingomonas vulcanisoli]|uniref:DNA-binding transcriptional LysR family regulator n=1 Tax=Sphingomonas vulcanisoli TaxID=1658060 RepID=A0ABX0TS27_9SPHN|nr:DNA-binding transcriptional LysR family regulator [Sphingomonas vulcanisoli]
MLRLETRLGLRLLMRTTRNVSPTEAGARLIETLGPAIDDIRARLAAITELREKPSGTVRITTSDHAARTILWPAARRLLPLYPDITIEISAESALTDIVAERFDAGIRLGENVAKDMIAVPVGPQLRMAAVASPAYLAQACTPLTPQDLAHHNCINLRLSRARGLYSWEFEKDGRELRVRVEGQLIVNRSDLGIQAAIDGLGIFFGVEDEALEPIAEGRLVRFLEDWTPPFAGYYLYYPSRRQPTPAFTILLEALRYRS